MPGASTSRSYGRRAPSASVTDRADASTAVAAVRATVMPSAATGAYVNCCALSSRRPAITALLNGQAVKVALGSIRVTAMPGSAFRRARAQLAPAKPPPTTTTRAAAPCAKVATGNSAAEAVTATADFKNTRRPVFIAAWRTRRRSPGFPRR